MIKRMNKITSLVVAAAAVLSLVPATGANAAERLDTKDGTIENAIAFKDGKYIYEGYKSDDSDKSIYYNDGSNDKELDEVSDADIDSKYDNDSAYLKDGSDEYLVDLSNGQVSDDNTPDDQLDNATTKLKSKLKKTDRYGESTDATLAKVTDSKFADTWYQYSATTDGDGTENAVDGKLFGYTNQAGQYIDVSRTANVYAYSYAKDKVVKVSNYNDFDTDAQLGVKLKGQPEYLTQDSDYIYSLVTVDITTSKEAFENNTTGAEATYIQKISKAQGDKQDDAYLPKSVDSYLVSNNIYDNSDVDDAYDYITNGVYGDKTKDTYVAKNGKLYITGVDSTKNQVKVAVINLGKIKEDAKTTFKNASGNTISGKLDGYVASLNTDPKHDIISSDDVTKAVSIDADGNTWALDKGVIVEFDGSEWKEVYDVDRSLNALDVYDANSLIAYEQDGDVYTTVTEGATSNGDTTTPTTPAQTGWVSTDAGWVFYDAAGTQVKGSWVNAGGNWYFINADGIMATGWYNANGTWYYLNPISDGTRGAMKTGWQYVNGAWYYLNNSGAMQTGWQYVNGAWYYLNNSGAMQTGWQYVNGAWYYLNNSGAMQTGWLNDNGTWYYLNASGAMLSNTTVSGYVLGSNGAWIR